METLDFIAMRTALALSSQISEFEKELIQGCVRKEMTKDINQTELLRSHGILKEKCETQNKSRKNNPQDFSDERPEYIRKVKKGDYSERLQELVAYGKDENGKTKKHSILTSFQPLPESLFREMPKKKNSLSIPDYSQLAKDLGEKWKDKNISDDTKKEESKFMKDVEEKVIELTKKSKKIRKSKDKIKK